MDELEQERWRFGELVPFYVNGTLGQTDLDFVEGYLKRNPAARAEVEFARRLRLAVKETASDRAEDEGLDRLLRAWHQEKASPGWGERISRRFRDWGFTPAFAVAAAIAVVQSAVIVAQLAPPGAEQAVYRGSAPEASVAPDLKIAVSPGADFGSVAGLLRENGCRIVAGPSESGELWVSVDERTRLEEVRQRLAASRLIDDVVPVGASGR